MSHLAITVTKPIKNFSETKDRALYFVTNLRALRKLLRTVRLAAWIVALKVKSPVTWGVVLDPYNRAEQIEKGKGGTGHRSLPLIRDQASRSKSREGYRLEAGYLVNQVVYSTESPLNHRPLGIILYVLQGRGVEHKAFPKNMAGGSG